MAIKQLSDGNPDGTTVGQSATDLVGFYGADPVDQPAIVANVTTSGTTVTRLNNLTTAVNAINDLLQELGLEASS